MKKVNVIFSLRDALKGAHALQNVGFIRDILLSEQFEVEIVDEDDMDLLIDELEALDLEFDIEEL